jgi:hypothetical protein
MRNSFTVWNIVNVEIPCSRVENDKLAKKASRLQTNKDEKAKETTVLCILEVISPLF